MLIYVLFAVYFMVNVIRAESATAYLIGKSTKETFPIVRRRILAKNLILDTVNDRLLDPSSEEELDRVNRMNLRVFKSLAIIHPLRFAYLLRPVFILLLWSPNSKLHVLALLKQRLISDDVSGHPAPVSTDQEIV